MLLYCTGNQPIFTHRTGMNYSHLRTGMNYNHLKSKQPLQGPKAFIFNLSLLAFFFKFMPRSLSTITIQIHCYTHSFRLLRFNIMSWTMFFFVSNHYFSKGYPKEHNLGVKWRSNIKTISVLEIPSSYLMKFNGHTNSRDYYFPQQFHVSKDPFIPNWRNTEISLK